MTDMNDTVDYDFNKENTDEEEIVDLTKELLIRNRTNLIEKKIFDDTFYDFYSKKTDEYLKILEKDIDDIDYEEYYHMFCLIIFPNSWMYYKKLPDDLLNFIIPKRDFLNIIKHLLNFTMEKDSNRKHIEEYINDFKNAISLIDDILKDDDKVNDVSNYCSIVMFLFYECYFKYHEEEEENGDELSPKETIPFDVKNFPMDLVLHTMEYGLEKNQGKPQKCSKEENIIELKKLKKSLIKSGKKDELEFILKLERECNLSFERY